MVATLGMSLTIPLAMVADMVIHGRHYSAIYILGSVQVMYYFKPASDLRISLKLRGKSTYHICHEYEYENALVPFSFSKILYDENN